MPDRAEPDDAPDPAVLEATAVSAGRCAAELIRADVGRAMGVGAKSSPTDVVTQTDLDAERAIRDALDAATPGSSFLGEEGGETTNPLARLQWIVDPLDGTVNFLYALPVIAVSIAAAVDGAVVAGAVVDVMRDEVFSAAAGIGARADAEPVTVSRCDDLAVALVATGFSYRSELRARQGVVVRRLLPAARDIRCFGSAALQLCWVGAARVDAYFERDLKVWDYAAGSLIAHEAGATIELPCPENDGLMLASGPALFEQVRALVDR